MLNCFVKIKKHRITPVLDFRKVENRNKQISSFPFYVRNLVVKLFMVAW